MPIALAFFVHYAYLILFFWVLAEQLGIPRERDLRRARMRVADRRVPIAATIAS